MTDMNKTRLTLFTAKLVQDTGLSVSGFEREHTVDRPFSIVNGKPTLVGRGLKGAVVAMAKRFFDPLPRAVTDDIRAGALRRSAWEFSDADTRALPRERAGVGILQKTGARATGVLYDYETIPAGTTWDLNVRVDWSHVLDEQEGIETEGILGYVLQRHWAKGRCWLGGGVARGLGWCHLENLQAWRFDEQTYQQWILSGRRDKDKPEPLEQIPVVSPTRCWCFRTLDVDLVFGERVSSPGEASWGIDMLAVGAHSNEGSQQPLGDGIWATPPWADAAADKGDAAKERPLDTDRAILMAGDRPLLPGSSVRGPMRHAFSRAKRAAGIPVKDPHTCPGADVGEDDPAGRAFGTVNRSSRILIRDTRAEADWAAAKLHMHAEDEFSAGSYETAKRDAVRVLRARFPVRIVVEGPDVETVEPLVKLVDEQVALGKLGHLPVGGHKTRGAGWGKWDPKPWDVLDIKATRSWKRPAEPPEPKKEGEARNHKADFEWKECNLAQGRVNVRVSSGPLPNDVVPTLDTMAQRAEKALGNREFTAWWCEPTIDLSVTKAPAIFGSSWPHEQATVSLSNASDESDTESADQKGELQSALQRDLQVDEVAFFAKDAVWRAARTCEGVRFVLIEQVSGQSASSAEKLSRVVDSADGSDTGAEKGSSVETEVYDVDVVCTPARLHGFRRFSSANTGRGKLLLREWHRGGGVLGFTIDTFIPTGKTATKEKRHAG